MALAYSQFGVSNLSLYVAYLGTFYDVECRDVLAGGRGILVGALGAIGSPTVGGGGAFGDAESVVGRGEGGGRDVGGESGVGSQSRSTSGAVGGAAGSGAGAAPCSAGGRLRDACGVFGDAAVRVASGTDGDAEGAGSEEGVGVPPTVGAVRGRNYDRNKRKREAAKAARRIGAARVGARGDECPSLTGTAETVVTAVAEKYEAEKAEFEARRTLALRRSAENKVAVKLAEHRYASLCDATKTEALGKLDAQRVAMRINEAKAKSQASFKKCDESLKSLGSTGSAGEFALKKEVKKGEEAIAELAVVQRQLNVAMRHLKGPVVQQIIEMDDLIPPKKSAHEIFGDCPSDYDDDQREAYYAELNSMDW